MHTIMFFKVTLPKYNIFSNPNLNISRANCAVLFCNREDGYAQKDELRKQQKISRMHRPKV